MNEQATQQSNEKRKITWQGIVDTVYMVSAALRRGGSAVVSVGPYASSVSVSPVVQTPSIPWKPVLIAGALAVGLLIVLKD